MNFDKLATSARPIDSTAARVLAKGVHFQVKRKEHNAQSWDAPPPAEAPKPAAVPDLAGVRRGWMTALRYHGAGGRWLCRCDCGKYELRRGGQWASKSDLPDACLDCRATHFVKTGCSHGFVRDGKNERKAME